MEVFAKDLRVGDVIQDGQIYKIVNHPSGLAFYDVLGELIQTAKPLDILIMEQW